MEVIVSTDAIIGLLKILNLEAHIPNVFPTTLLAYGFIKNSFKGNPSPPTRINENSSVSPYHRISALMDVC